MNPQPPPRARQPHCDADPRSRRQKARKIEVILSRRRDLRGARLLEIGAGSGHMAASFAQAVGAEGDVWAVDVHDNLETSEGFRFQVVEGVELPFEDGSFDIVVSNHVMEHVGEVPDQIRHLAEIRRVLRPAGLLYLSVPNRWRLYDKHFHLPLVSWLPRRLADAYVRLSGRGDWYDVLPPTGRTMRRLLAAAGLTWQDCTLEAMRVISEVEDAGFVERLVLRAPTPIIKLGMPIVPSLIYVGRRA